MSTTLTPAPDPAAQEAAPDRARPRTARRVGLAALVLATIGLVMGGSLMVGWMIDETHFERPTPAFDEFQAQIEGLPGVESVEKNRWVEAPTFAQPTSWMSVTVDESGLRAVLDAACSAVYPEPVTWTIRVRTATTAEITLNGASTGAGPSVGARGCVDFGFDAVPLVSELDRVAPGLSIQPAKWEDGRFAFVALDEVAPAGFTGLLPLIEHADALAAAAGLDDDESVEFNSANLGFILEPGEGPAYLSLLTELAEVHAVSSFWADGGGTQVDAVAKVQIVAPATQHAAIEAAIASSGLGIAQHPVHFLEQ